MNIDTYNNGFGCGKVALEMYGEMFSVHVSSHSGTEGNRGMLTKVFINDSTYGLCDPAGPKHALVLVRN